MILAKGMSPAAQALTGLAVLAAVVFGIFMVLWFVAGWADAATDRTKAQAERHRGAAAEHHAKAYWWQSKARQVEVRTAIEVDVHRRRVRELEEARARRELPSFDTVPDNPFDDIEELLAIEPPRQRKGGPRWR